MITEIKHDALLRRSAYIGLGTAGKGGSLLPHHIDIIVPYFKI
jgi:hypothetical protein